MKAALMLSLVVALASATPMLHEPLARSLQERSENALCPNAGMNKRGDEFIGAYGSDKAKREDEFIGAYESDKAKREDEFIGGYGSDKTKREDEFIGGYGGT